MPAETMGWILEADDKLEKLSAYFDCCERPNLLSNALQLLMALW